MDSMIDAILIEFLIHELATLIAVQPKHKLGGKARMVVIDLCQQMFHCSASFALSPQQSGIEECWSRTL